MISQKESKIKELATEASDLIESNLGTNKTIETLNDSMKEFESSGKTLMKYKSESKDQSEKETAEKEEKFFSDNSVCPPVLRISKNLFG